MGHRALGQRRTLAFKMCVKPAFRAKKLLSQLPIYTGMLLYQGALARLKPVFELVMRGADRSVTALPASSTAFFTTGLHIQWDLADAACIR